MTTPLEFTYDLLSPLPYPRVRAAIGKALHWRYRLLQANKHRNVVLEHIRGCSFLVTPGVLNPRLMRTGDFFASQLDPQLVPRGSEVLDMGTGSGVCAVVAGMYAKHVVAVDIAPAAVRCARLNVLLNGMEDKIEVHCGDLFAPLTGRRFDIALFNPPFIRGAPWNDADRAWRSNDVAERFAAGLDRHLKPSGYGLVLLSTYGHPETFICEFERRGFKISAVAERRFINEKLVILKLTPG
jgi:HemK-related putative methylase